MPASYNYSDHIRLHFTQCWRVRLQVTGTDLQEMDIEELREIVTDCTRVECKLFLRRIRDVEAASKVSEWCHGL